MLRCLVDYRPTSRLTGKPLRLTAPGLGLCPITRPRSDRLVRTRRTRPTEQLALRIRCLAWPSLNPSTRGTRQRAGGGGGGVAAAEAVVAEVAAEVVAEVVAAVVAEAEAVAEVAAVVVAAAVVAEAVVAAAAEVVVARQHELLHAGEAGRRVDAPAGSDHRVADSHARRERARCEQRRHRRPGVRRRVVLGDVVQPVEGRAYSCRRSNTADPRRLPDRRCSSPSACPPTGRRSSTRPL